MRVIKFSLIIISSIVVSFIVSGLFAYFVYSADLGYVDLSVYDVDVEPVVNSLIIDQDSLFASKGFFSHVPLFYDGGYSYRVDSFVDWLGRSGYIVYVFSSDGYFKSESSITSRMDLISDWSLISSF